MKYLLHVTGPSPSPELNRQLGSTTTHAIVLLTSKPWEAVYFFQSPPTSPETVRGFLKGIDCEIWSVGPEEFGSVVSSIAGMRGFADRVMGLSNWSASRTGDTHALYVEGWDKADKRPIRRIIS